MKAIHFFKAKSRIGLAHPHDSRKGQNDIGVENGSDAILTDDFLVKFPECHVSEYSFSKPEEIKRGQFDKILAGELNDFKEFINKHLIFGQIQVVIGGDHSVTLPSVLALGERIGGFENLGYVQFDSHGDTNLKASSPTGNFHGMYARALADRFDIPEIEKLVSYKLPIKNMIFVGNLVLDCEEGEFFYKNNILNINGEALSTDRDTVIKNFRDFVSSFKYLHTTFDIDVLNKIQAPATGIPAENGLMLEDLEELLDAISNHPNLSFDLTEVNPHKDGLKQTIANSHNVLMSSLVCYHKM